MSEIITSISTLTIHDIYMQIRVEYDSRKLSNETTQLLINTLQNYLIEYNLYLIHENQDYIKDKIRVYNEFNSFERRVYQGFFAHANSIYDYYQNEVINQNFEEYHILLAFHLRNFKNNLTFIDKFLTNLKRDFNEDNRNFNLFLRNLIRQNKTEDLIPPTILDACEDWVSHAEIKEIQKLNQPDRTLKPKEQKSFLLKKFQLKGSRDNVHNINHIHNFKKQLEHHKFIAETGEGSGRIFISLFDGTFDNLEPYFKWITDIKELHGLIVLLKDEYKLLTNMGKYHWLITSKIFKNIDNKIFSTDQLRKNNNPDKDKLNILRGIIESTLLKIS